MKNPRFVLIAAVAGTVAVIAAIVIGVSMHSIRTNTPDTLALRYFRALAASDEADLKALRSDTFETDLPVPTLKKGNYALYDFGAEDEDTRRILLVLPEVRGERQSAILADLSYRKAGLGYKVDSIRTVDSGLRLDK